MTKLIHGEIAKLRLTEEHAASSSHRFPVIAILEHVRSLYNVGSMFRTADAARLEALYTVGYTPHPPRPEIEKTALGATRTVPHKHFDTVQEAIAECRSQNRKIASLELTTNSRSIYSLSEKDFPLALVIGNEITGVSEEAIALSDFTLEIPMMGAKHSLNVAVAFGIALFESVRVFEADLERFKP